MGTVLGPYFGDYKAGFRFGQLGLDLVEQRGMDRLKARVYLAFGNLASPSMRHVRMGRPLMPSTRRSRPATSPTRPLAATA